MADTTGPGGLWRKKVGPAPIWVYAIALLGVLIAWRFYASRGKETTAGEGEAEALGPSSSLEGPISPETVIVNPPPTITIGGPVISNPITPPPAPPVNTAKPPLAKPKPPVGKYITLTTAGAKGLDAIAKKYHRSSASIWAHAANAPLRTRTHNSPSGLKKGDKVFVSGLV